ncbi:MAG: mechanosensitive ion channel family protein [Candidatus Methanoperedens sp.]|nr:mechanosensitive ion channel family protein [Candidatus Methanoperedens sp.]
MTRHTHKRILEEPKLKTTYQFIERVVIATIFLVGVTSITFTAFPETRGFVASIFVAAGFASIVIGLAAQSTLSNLISGALIAFAQPFRIGDTVMFRKEFCSVEDIKLTYTTLRAWDNRRLMIPNSIFQNEVVTNYTKIDPTKLVPIQVQISYESNLEKASEIMIGIAKNHPYFLPAGDLPKVHLMEFAASGVNLRLLTRAKDQDTAFEMSKEILRLIKKEFETNSIEIPYPRMHFIPDKKLEERMDRLANNLGAHSEKLSRIP